MEKQHAYNANIIIKRKKGEEEEYTRVVESILFLGKGRRLPNVKRKDVGEQRKKKKRGKQLKTLGTFALLHSIGIIHGLNEEKGKKKEKEIQLGYYTTA